MKIEGAKDVVLAQLPGSRVSLTFQFDTPEQADRAYLDLREKARAGSLPINLTLGGVIPEH